MQKRRPRGPAQNCLAGKIYRPTRAYDDDPSAGLNDSDKPFMQ